jgi:biopolymer transport protein ExbD
MVFLLLIFFLVATKFADIERDVRVKPPSSRHARPITAEPQELIVNITHDGRLLVAGRELTPEGLDGLLAKTVAENPRQVVVVRGDKGSILQYAVNVLDLCEKRGVDRTFLTTSKTGE